MTPVTRKVRVKVPATSANLGSGFDTVGLALDYHDELEFTLSADPVNTAAQVMIEGEGEDTLPRDETHLVVSTFRRACQTFGLGRVGFILQAHNNIPQARGMGIITLETRSTPLRTPAKMMARVKMVKMTKQISAEAPLEMKAEK